MVRCLDSMPSTCSTYSQYCCTCCSQQTKRHTLQGGKEYLSQERVGSSGAQKGCGWLGGLPRQMSARKNMMQARTDRAARLRRGARRQSCCSVTASGRATPGQPAQQVSHPDASHKDHGMPLRRLPSASSLYWVPLESLYTWWWHLLCMHGVLLLHLTRTACGKREKKETDWRPPGSPCQRLRAKDIVLAAPPLGTTCCSLLQGHISAAAKRESTIGQNLHSYGPQETPQTITYTVKTETSCCPDASALLCENAAAMCLDP